MGDAIAAGGIAALKETGEGRREREGESSIMEKGAPVCCSAPTLACGSSYCQVCKKQTNVEYDESNKESGSLPRGFVYSRVLQLGPSKSGQKGYSSSHPLCETSLLPTSFLYLLSPPPFPSLSIFALALDSVSEPHLPRCLLLSPQRSPDSNTQTALAARLKVDRVTADVGQNIQTSLLSLFALALLQLWGCDLPLLPTSLPAGLRLSISPTACCILNVLEIANLSEHEHPQPENILIVSPGAYPRSEYSCLVHRTLVSSWGHRCFPVRATSLRWTGCIVLSISSVLTYKWKMLNTSDPLSIIELVKCQGENSVHNEESSLLARASLVTTLCDLLAHSAPQTNDGPQSRGDIHSLSISHPDGPYSSTLLRVTCIVPSSSTENEVDPQVFMLGDAEVPPEFTTALRSTTRALENKSE
ncbi:unnamed protein product [Pleuronectes platessa]|uniref:Uncharacterized protein n=1 Tax=Pleuronectes platessa TaxID=8262 RepID=A0A9N7UII7_PLEPL|nr:unnamed protein product [Pleuronectes platessa]